MVCLGLFENSGMLGFLVFFVDFWDCSGLFENSGFLFCLGVVGIFWDFWGSLENPGFLFFLGFWRDFVLSAWDGLQTLDFCFFCGGFCLKFLCFFENSGVLGFCGAVF